MTLQVKDFRPRVRNPRSGRALPAELPEQTRTNIADAEALIGQPFRGVTEQGQVVPGLFSLARTGVPNRPLKEAAEAFLASLGPAQRSAAQFSLDSDVWRRWSNIHAYLMRHGALLDAMAPNQRDLALALLEEALSPGGYRTARDVMRLNESIREITGSDDEYGEWLYWLSVMGNPSAAEPWGWQIDGHHLIVNCFVLEDQLVLTPMFMGSEPVAVSTGKYAGTRVFEAEEQMALTLALTLSREQRSQAIISPDLPSEVFTTAFRDNLELKPQGLLYSELDTTQQSLLLDLIGVYVNRMRPGHAQVKLNEVQEHLGQTRLAWMGGMDQDSVFYYRIHSPVVLIEFDHQRGIALDNDTPSRNHIHTVVRTPNGNDYGKDLLRQHREQVAHSHN